MIESSDPIPITNQPVNIRIYESLCYCVELVFVGSHLVEHLLKLPESEEVRVLVRNKEKWLKGLDYTLG